MLCLINLENNDIRLEIIPNRNEVKSIIEKNIDIGNIIYTDSWSGYNCLHQVNSGYTHNYVNHSHGIFGLTSHIEGLGNEIKTIIKKMYNFIHFSKFAIFLRETEYRRSIRNLKNSDKLKDFASITSSISPVKLIKEEEPYEINYEEYYDD